MPQQNQEDDYGWLAPLIGFVGLLAGTLFFSSNGQQNLTNNNNNLPPPPPSSSNGKPGGCGCNANKK
jgi:hypothetical protein